MFVDILFDGRIILDSTIIRGVPLAASGSGFKEPGPVADWWTIRAGGPLPLP